jgi:hypothetical protein
VQILLQKQKSDESALLEECQVAFQASDWLAYDEQPEVEEAIKSPRVSSSYGGEGVWGLPEEYAFTADMGVLGWP